MREKIREKKTVDYQSPSLAGENSIMQDVTRDRRTKGRCSRVEMEMQLGGEGDAARWRGRKARGGRLDGPGRLFGRPEASNQTARGG